jgi:hypothetical protein
VFFSYNNGSNWIAVNNGLTNLHVFTLAAHGAYIFAGTGNMVFQSVNNGGMWEPISDTLPDLIQSISINGPHLYAGTFGSGVWHHYIEALDISEEKITANDMTIFPNPLNTSSVIQLSHYARNAELTIHDMLGRECLRQTFSGNRVEIVKGKLKVGVYFVRINADGRQFVRRLVVQ